jgi:hypothetical protein
MLNWNIYANIIYKHIRMHMIQTTHLHNHGNNKQNRKTLPSTPFYQQ